MNAKTFTAVSGLVLVVGAHVAIRHVTVTLGADLGLSPVLAVALVAVAGLVVTSRLDRA